MAGHNVVIATTPPGMRGNVNAGRLAGPMFKTFPNIRITVLVGIGGGVPSGATTGSAIQDIHLGDVVVGWPADGKPAVVYHETGRSGVNGLEMLGTIDRPDWALLNALGILQSNQRMRRAHFGDHVSKLLNYDEQQFKYPGQQLDKLFRADYQHQQDSGNFTKCKIREIVERKPRSEQHIQQLIFHQGRIGTGNSVVMDGKLRDQISERCGGLQCIEMSAAGVDASRNCLVIRGISNYCDSHKNGIWKSYAAGRAAVFARELLGMIQPRIVEQMETVVGGR